MSTPTEAIVETTNPQLTLALEGLRHSLESVIYHSPAAMALMSGPDFTFSIVNSAYEALLPGEQILGRTVASVWPDAACLILPILTVVRDAQTVYRATDFKVPVGHGPVLPEQAFHFDSSYLPITGFGREGEVDVLVVAVDIGTHGQIESVRAQLEAIHTRAPLALLVIDQQLQVRSGNALAARFAGLELADLEGLAPCKALGCGNSPSYSCRTGPSCSQCPLCLALLDTLTNGTTHDGIETWSSSEADQGEQRCLEVSTTAITIQRTRKALVCAQDITQRRKLEAELLLRQEESDRQTALLAFSHDAIVTCDGNWVISGWNRGAEELYGWRETESVGKNIHLLLCHNSSSPEAPRDWRVDQHQWNGEVERRHRDGRRVLVDSRQVVLRDAEDVRILVIDRDITARRDAEEILNKALNEKTVLLQEKTALLQERTVLLQEIHHRVKNSLAVTASLLSMKADSSPPDAKLALEESQQRVHSIALVHEHLYASERLDRIDFGGYARELAEGIYSAFTCEQGNVGLHLELDPIEVAIQIAVPCALILNELLTNAFKYAFADERAGRIMVSLSEPEAGRCELVVQDDGVGLAPGVLGGQAKSLGLRIVKILTDQIEGSIEQSDCCPGTRIVLRFTPTVS